MRVINFVDIETTGLDPAFHDVIEVGIIRAEFGEEVEAVEFSVPFDMDKADPEALSINGWGEREFAREVSIDDGLNILTNCFSEDEYFISWHTTLDEAFLQQFFRRRGKQPPWSHRRVIDLPSFIMGKFGIVTPGSSRVMLRQLGINPEYMGRHRAITDARMNLEAYSRLQLWEVQE